MTIVSFVTLIIILIAILATRSYDVRFCLLLASLLIGLLAGDLPAIIRTFLGTFSDEKYVLPICTAMGFAYVLKHTGCDQELVRWLIEPIRHVRGLLIPGVVCTGFFVNITVPSQTSSVVCLGTVVVPIMRSAGYSPLAIGSCMLLGCSVGGELLNPAAPELLTVHDLTHVETTILTSRYLPPVVFPVLIVSTLSFWFLTIWRERKTATVTTEQPSEIGSRPSFWTLPGACVPMVPLVILMLTGPPFNVLKVPDSWLADGGKKVESRLIGFAMLIGVLVAAVVKPKSAGGCLKAFFEGAGYGFTNVISLIVVANCFGKSIFLAGLAQTLGQWIQSQPVLLLPLAAGVPWIFAMISGSGISSTQSLYIFFYGPASDLQTDPNEVGAMVSVGSAVGRTMSPFAAVTLMCVTLTGCPAISLIRRVAIPLILGLIFVVMLRMC